MRGEFVDVGGVRLYYYAAGTRGAGEPVVLIHGFPTSSFLWRGLIPLLPAGRRVVALDLLGYGRSDRPGVSGLSASAHADRLHSLIRELHIERACIVGHDFGAAVAMRFAASFPDRVSRLCLIDPAVGAHWSVRPSARRPFARFLGSPLLAPIVRPAVRSEILSGYMNPDMGARSAARYLRPFAGSAGAVIMTRHLAALPKERDYLTLPHGAAPAHSVNAEIPTAIVYGTENRLVPHAHIGRLHSQLASSTLHLLDGMGHFSPEEAPARLSVVLAELLAR